MRLRLDRSWLPDTEVRIAHSSNGLMVEFMSENVEAQRFLMPNLSTLGDRLAERTGEKVAVAMSEQMNTGEGSSQDGRSRNRHTLFYENSDNDSGN